MNCEARTVPERKSGSTKYGRQWDQSNFLLWQHG